MYYSTLISNKKRSENYLCSIGALEGRLILSMNARKCVYCS